jgi:hypothetical protein
MNWKINNLTMETVFEFLYSSENSYNTMSIHRTQKGAEIALEFHKNKIKKEWEKENMSDSEREAFPFDFDQSWGIRETKLED